MGFEYPIKIEGTRYCTAEYKNESWVSEVKSAATNANASYERFKVKYREAERLDKICGISAYEPQSPKNNCNDGYSLNMRGRVCEKTLPLINECREGSYNAAQDTCVVTHDPIRSNVPLYKDPETGETKCLAISEGDDCVTYTSVPPTTASPKRCETGGSVVNGQCLYTKSACEPRYQLLEIHVK